MSIGCGLFVEITPVAYVDPFEMPSRSIGQLCGNRTFVGRAVLKIIRNIVLKFLNVTSRNMEVVGFTLLEPGSSGIYPTKTRRRRPESKLTRTQEWTGSGARPVVWIAGVDPAKNASSHGLAFSTAYYDMSFSDFFWLLSAPTWVSHSQRFIMSFDEASKLFSAPAWANHSQPHFPLLSSWSCLPLSLGNLEKHVALASFRSISGYIATKSGSKVVGACFFVESLGLTSM
ncbi:hypothetical protein DY000_02020530 [Brassica cretica]|uniref:Uncharacterized protein n=1 Tax=Brassica cretica TaxID=69181 RepID=A0ABQ7EAB5_BRACR|nr:hypothetical protein DY000_02020530 [Brassica cretica]